MILMVSSREPVELTEPQAAIGNSHTYSTIIPANNLCKQIHKRSCTVSTDTVSNVYVCNSLICRLSYHHSNCVERDAQAWPILLMRMGLLFSARCPLAMGMSVVAWFNGSHREPNWGWDLQAKFTVEQIRTP